MKQRRLFFGALIGTALLLAAAYALLHQIPVQPFPSITIGPDTTLLTGPLAPDGSVDYTKAIDEQAAKGVTPEDNAFAAALEICGTSDFDLGPAHREIAIRCGAKESAGLWKRLSDKGVSEEQSRQRSDLLYAIVGKPWTGAEHPDIAAWLDTNRECFTLFAEASRREHFYVPCCRSTPDESLLSAIDPNLLPSIGRIADAMRLRLYKSLGEGRSQEVLNDTLVLRRWARLLAHGNTVMDMSQAYSLEGVANSADFILLKGQKGDHELYRQYLSELSRLTPLPNERATARRAEIYIFPDAVQNMARAAKTAYAAAPKTVPAYVYYLARNRMVFPNWDRMLRYGNAFFRDYYADPTGNSPEQKRQSALSMYARLRSLSEEHDRARERAGDQEFNLPLPGESQDQFSNRLARQLVCMLSPSLADVDVSYLSQNKLREMLCVLSALRLFQFDKGSYPEKLEQLVPGYLNALPLDLNDKPLEYECTAQHLVVQSPGVLRGSKPPSTIELRVEFNDQHDTLSK